MSNIAAMFLGFMAYYLIAKLFQFLEKKRFSRYTDTVLKEVLNPKYQNKQQRLKHYELCVLSAVVVMFYTLKRPIMIGYPYNFACIVKDYSVCYGKIYVKLIPIDQHNKILFREGIDLPAEAVFQVNKGA